jgi:hypothetical protein
LLSNITVFLFFVQSPTFKNSPGTSLHAPGGIRPILVDSYDTHGLQWDYSSSPLTTRGRDPTLGLNSDLYARSEKPETPAELQYCQYASTTKY